jgi:cytochrome P450
MKRKAMKDFTFSDGTLIPKGTFVAVPSYAMHHDENIYADPHEFQGARFEKMRGQLSPGEAARHQMISTNPEYLLFGYGRHACPGRFFAVNELKVILSHVVVHYDVKLEGEFPQQGWHGPSMVPNRNAAVLFKSRE